MKKIFTVLFTLLCLNVSIFAASTYKVEDPELLGTSYENIITDWDLFLQATQLQNQTLLFLLLQTGTSMTCLKNIKRLLRLVGVPAPIASHSRILNRTEPMLFRLTDWVTQPLRFMQTTY